VRTAVLDAAFKLLIERGYHGLTIGDVALVAGVHETTIYRRWQNVAGLALDACLEAVSGTVPTPNTGSLRNDLVALLRTITQLLGSPKGQGLLELCRITDVEAVQARSAFFVARFGAAEQIFERAAQRGEWSTDNNAKLLLELLIAPLYLRALVTNEPVIEWPIGRVVDALLAMAKTTSALHVRSSSRRARKLRPMQGSPGRSLRGSKSD
jgi:AcrR family transcriptional regulator